MKETLRRAERVAAGQHGVVGRYQALECGMDARTVDRCVESGRWLRVYPATYVIAGAPTSWKQKLIAATLSVQGSVVSHRSAAALWGCPGFGTGVVELTVPSRVDRPGTKLHRTKSLSRREVRHLDGIPVTDPERTLIDVSAVSGGELVESALDHFLSRRYTTLQRLDARLSHLNGSGWRGTKLVKQLVSERDPRDGHAESRLETKLFRVLRTAKFPLPARQVPIYDGDGFVGRVDVAYPQARLIIEAQSYEFHSGKQAWTKDIRRRRSLAVSGWRVIEVTWWDLTAGRDAFLQDLRALLEQPSLAI